MTEGGRLRFWFIRGCSLFCVILSAAKDLDGRSDDRRQLHTALKSAKDRLVTTGGVSLDSKLTKGGRELNRTKLRDAAALLLLLALAVSIASCGGSNTQPCRVTASTSRCANSAAVGGTGMPSSPYAPR